MELKLLADHQQAIPIIAGWYFEEWGHLESGNNLEKVTEGLNKYLNTDKIPLIVIAIEEKEILGAAQLKYREMSRYPEKEHWLGGVYVSKKYRGNKIAEQMINKVIILAKKFGVQHLYLQTFDLSGGLYRRMGWKAVEQVKNYNLDVLVMDKTLVEIKGS